MKNERNQDLTPHTRIVIADPHSLMFEAMASVFCKRPVKGFSAVWDAYVNDQLLLCEAATVVGLSKQQFIEIASRRAANVHEELPQDITEIATEEQLCILTWLNARQLALLQQIGRNSLLFPPADAFVTLLWSDLHLLERLGLVEAARDFGNWKYTLSSAWKRADSTQHDAVGKVSEL